MLAMNASATRKSASECSARTRHSSAACPSSPKAQIAKITLCMM
jgi:hypothetical protein